MSSEPPAKKMKEMEESSEKDLEFAAHSSSEKVTLDELVLFNCVSQAFLCDHLILKCASRRLAAIVQQQNAVQPVFVDVTDVKVTRIELNNVEYDGPACDYSRVVIERYRSKRSKSGIAVTDGWIICDGEDLEHLLVLIFSQFKRFKCLHLQSFKMSALTDILIYALSEEGSFAPLQLSCLTLDGDFKGEVNWYIIKRFSRLIRQLDVKWPRLKTVEEKRLFWNIVARCKNLRRLTTITHCKEDFFFFDNKFQMVADGAKSLHVKYGTHDSVVEMYFPVSPMVQENAATSSEVGIKEKKVQMQVRSHLKAGDRENLICLAHEILRLLPKDLSNVDVAEWRSPEEALLINVLRFLSYGASIHVCHCPQFKEMDGDENVTSEMFFVIALLLRISAKFDRVVDLMFLFLDADNLIQCFINALQRVEACNFDELQIVRDNQKPEFTVTGRRDGKNAKVVIGFAPA